MPKILIIEDDEKLREELKIYRKRWKIENEGFNIQKNGTFDIGHLYSKNATAIKIHYLMIQIAHISCNSPGLNHEIFFKSLLIIEIKWLADFYC